MTPSTPVQGNLQQAMLRSRLESLKGLQAQGKSEPEQARHAAAEFEALLTEQMVKSMRETVPESPFFSGPGREMWTEMLDGEYVRLMQARGGLGLREMLTQDMLRLGNPQQRG